MIGLELSMNGAATSFYARSDCHPGSVSISDRARALLALEAEKELLIKEQLRLAHLQWKIIEKLGAIEVATERILKT